EAPEAGQRGLVQLRARGGAAILDQHALKAAIGSIARGGLHTAICRDADDCQAATVQRAQDRLEAARRKAANRRLVQHRLACERTQLVQNVVLTLSNPIANGTRERSHVLTKIAVVV